VTATYSYNGDSGSPGGLNSGELWKIDYSDGTPDVTFLYDHMGRAETVKDAVSPTNGRTYAYDSATLDRVSETFDSGALFGPAYINFDTYDETSDRQVITQIGYGPDPNHAGDYYNVDYTYDADSGRMVRINGGGLHPGTAATSGAFYSYLTNSTLISKIEYKKDGDLKYEQVRGYEADHNLLADIRMVYDPSGTPVTKSRYDYQYDDIGRRSDVAYSGEAFGGSGNEKFDAWDYNDRNELTDNDRFAGTPASPGSADHAFDRDYAYDPIGNRLTAQVGDPNAGLSHSYKANNLNQYWRINETGTSAQPAQRLEYDEDGNVTKIFAAADMNGDGDVNVTDLGLLLSTPYACDPNSNYNPNADFNGDGCVNITDYGILLALFGQTSIGAELSWDAENRLIAHTPLAPAVGDQKTTFTYDYMGRRVQKQVFDWDLNDPNDGEDDAWATTPATHRKFLWYNWLMIAELDGSDDSRVRTYTWGLDLSGNSIESAGGVGGLLAIRDFTETPADNYLVCYDGNGNVGQLLRRSSGSIEAWYEYDAYGNPLLDLNDPNQSGPYAAENPMRFSTKYWDDETGFGYWGYRYYSAGTGRWLSRDPILEEGGPHIYAYVRNRPTFAVDPYGLEEACNCVGPPADIISWMEGGRGYGTLINSSTNQPPPDEFGEVDMGGVRVVQTIGSYLSKKDFRNHLFVMGWVKCCNGKVLDGGGSASQTVGYTNLAFGTHTEGLGHVSPPEVNKGETCVRVVGRARFRVSNFLNYAAALGTLSFDLMPWAWSEIEYRICCDKSVYVHYSGSIVPSHTGYLDGKRVASYSMNYPAKNAERIGKFMARGINEDAPGNMFGSAISEAKCTGE
jgi:RHS repeat-associated protein